MMIGGLADPLAVVVSHSNAYVGVQIQIPNVDDHMSRELEEIGAALFFFCSFNYVCF